QYSSLAPAYDNPLDSQDSRSGLELLSQEIRTRGFRRDTGSDNGSSVVQRFWGVASRGGTTPLRWKGASYGHAPTPYPSLHADRDPHLAITGSGAAAGGARQAACPGERDRKDHSGRDRHGGPRWEGHGPARD